MSYGKLDGCRMKPTAVSFTHQHLTTHITALSVQKNLVLIGEGQHCHAHDVASGRQVASTQVFRAAVVHGIRIQPSSVDSNLAWIVLVFGQKSLAVLLFCTADSKFYVLLHETSVEDWIVDAGMEKDLSHIVVATGHNSLLRCQIPDLAERCRNLSRQASGNSSDDVLSRNSYFSISKTSQESQEPRCGGVSNSGDMSVVARVACVERRVLFSGHLVMMSGCWEGAVMLAGTMALQVMVWGPWGTRDSEGNALPLHCLWGHQGSIFSITFSPSQGFITTTSDDRSLRVWEVRQREVRHRVDNDVPTNPKEEQDYWRTVNITEKFALYGHRARVWHSLILPPWFVSVGEDSLVCVWGYSGELAASWRAHDGASIWRVVASEGAEGRLIITGGADGSVKSWSVSAAAPINAEVLSGLPWRDPVPDCDHGNSALPLRSCSGVTIEKGTNDALLNSEVECLTPECHELFRDGPQDKPAMKMKTTEIATADFPRCIALLDENIVLVVTDNGELYSHSPEKSWCLELKDRRLRNYAILETDPRGRRVAVGTLTGTVLVLQLTSKKGRNEGQNLQLEAEALGPPGKVFALQWLTADRILVLGAAGLMTTWEIQAEGAARIVSNHHLPVSMHRWLCAVYVLPRDNTTPDTCTPPQHLVCGDRAGSLHLYSVNDRRAQDTLQGIHGRNGVTSLLSLQGGVVFSSGRDGCVRSLRIRGSCLLTLTVTRVSGANWVARLFTLWGKLLAVCFHGVKLRLWSVKEEQTLLEVECGGAHRSWDLRVCGVQGRLECGFLKDGLPYTFSASLKDRLLPLIKPPLSALETMGASVLLQQDGEIVLVTAGEDTTVRLHAMRPPGERLSLGVLRSHLSGVRALCLVEDRDAKWRGQMADGTVWMVSAGGRAEFKVWQCNMNKHSSNIPRNAAHHSSFGDPYTLPSGQRSSVEGDPFLSSQLLNVTCREVGSHMLRTGCHKTWRSQQLTFDPETRYMGATAFWVSSSLALLALASSDGFLRIFSLSECESLGEARPVKVERLGEVCAARGCSCCMLAVARLWVPSRTMLVTCSTRGHVTFWDLQAVTEWSLQHTASQEDLSQSSPEPYEVITVAAHQAGVNSMTFLYHPDDPTHITMATGGDDNEISVWEVVVVVPAKGSGVELTVTRQCSVFGHASQVSGLSWLSREHLISASIDQRLIVWRYKGGDGPPRNEHTQDGAAQIGSSESCRTSRQFESVKCHRVLVPVDYFFTGVPDVKGIVVTDVSGSEKIENGSSGVIRKRVLVYGAGLQVVDVAVGES